MLAHRLRVLVFALVAALVAGLLARMPPFGVPGYEAGLLTGLMAALAGSLLGFELARARPAFAELRWGVLRKTPGEAVHDEARAALLGLTPVVAIPLFLFVTQAARSGCNWSQGLFPFLFVSLPAAFGGVALGVLIGSLTRRRSAALGLLLTFVLFSVLTTFAEGLAGPRHVVHDLLLGPLSIGAYTGYDRGLSFPSSVYLHRLFSMIAFAAMLAFAAWWRTRSDAPSAPPVAEEPSNDGGWSSSRADDATRTRFLLCHHRRGPRRLLALLGVLALPFLCNPHACGLLSGRSLLKQAMPSTLETAHFRIHHAGGTSVEAHLERLAVEHEQAWLQICAWLEIEPDWKVDAWLHPSEESLHRATGARGYVFAAPWNHEYHAVVRGGDLPQLRHELVHVLAADFGAWPFRASLSPGLIEGLATALDEGFARLPEAHEAIAAAHAAGQVPSAERLCSVLGFAGSDMDLSYRAAASFVGYLLREHGPAKLKAAYSRARFEEAYGSSLEQLGREWSLFLETEVRPSAGEAARARRRFDPGSHPAFHREACPRLGLVRAATTPAQRAQLLAQADRPEDAADAWCEAFRLSADPGHLDAASRERVRAGELETALVLLDRTLAAPLLDADRVTSALRRRSLLLSALGRPDEASAALVETAASLGVDAALDGEGPPADPDLEQLRLDLIALGSPFAVAYAKVALEAHAAGAESASAELLARWGDSAPLLRLALLASKPVGGAAGRRRDELARRFAGLSPDSPALAGEHLMEQAAAAERATDWERAAGLYGTLRDLSGLPALELLAASDGHERALNAPAWGRAALSSQPGP